jgi:hypothetical protein
MLDGLPLFILGPRPAMITYRPKVTVNGRGSQKRFPLAVVPSCQETAAMIEMCFPPSFKSLLLVHVAKRIRMEAEGPKCL